MRSIWPLSMNNMGVALFWVISHISMLSSYTEKRMEGLILVEISDNVLHTCSFVMNINVYNQENICHCSIFFYHCSLRHMTVLIKQHIITSSAFKSGTSSLKCHLSGYRLRELVCHTHIRTYLHIFR